MNKMKENQGLKNQTEAPLKGDQDLRGEDGKGLRGAILEKKRGAH